MRLATQGWFLRNRRTLISEVDLTTEINRSRPPPPPDMTGPRVLIGGHRRTTKLQGAGVRMGTERPQQSEGGVMGLACDSELGDIEAR